MDFRVLGVLAVADEQGPVTIRRRKCRALLALLLSHHPHTLSADAVVDALWVDADPVNGLNSVRVHATYLRQALGTHADLLPRTAGGYRLAVDRADIDAARFEDRIAAAREAAAAGDAHRAADEFAVALGTWGGEPYRDFPEVDALRPERARLERMWLDALEGYATVLLDDDRADEACRLLAPVAGVHLHHETLVARLMLGLHRTGRQHEALTLFSRVKDELDPRGMVPTPQLQELANAILLHDTALDAARAVPARSRVVPPRRRADFIGRNTELHALIGAWTVATSGTPQLVHLSGEAGLGKTTLIRRLADHVDADGGIVVMGGCQPDPIENFQPFPELVRRVLQEDPPADSLPTMLGELARLAPDLRGQLPDTSEAPEPGAGRQRLFTAVGELVAAPTRPRLLVVEDLHWARPDALMLLRHVMRRARGQLMVVLSYRRQELEAPDAFGATGMTGRLTRPDLRLGLEPMDHHEVRALIDALAPNERREEWISEVHELVAVSAGNPLRVREVLRQLELEPDVPVAEIVPETVRGLVSRRLRSLPPDARVVMQTASVLGRVFTLDELVAATGLDEAVVLGALEDSMGQGLVMEGERVDDFAFVHPTFRNGVYYSLAQSRRARIHLRCGDAIVASATDARGEGRRSEAARHYVAARPVSDPRRTAAYAERAGDDATRRYAHDEAVDWYRHAVSAAIDAALAPVEIGRLRLALGSELELFGDLTAARVEYFTVADIARTIADLALLADAAVAATPRES
ncbi:MAG: BTAD domain-containing putative transcriptional regulator, partial [Acidimicrobiia bacterium]